MLRNTLITLAIMFTALPAASASHKSGSQQARADAAHHAERGNASAAKAAADRAKSRERAEQIKARNDAKAARRHR